MSENTKITFYWNAVTRCCFVLQGYCNTTLHGSGGKLPKSKYTLSDKRE